MKKIIFIFTLLVLSVNILAFADSSEQVITLKDGSQVKGTLVKIDNGVYDINTPIIGVIHVAASDVASISNGIVPVTALPTSAQVPGSIPNLDQQVAASQQQLMSNPQSVEALQQMLKDPEIMQALQDPALVQAVTNHDYQAVQNNPEVQKLMTNPKMQAIIQKLAAQQHQQNSSSQ